MMTQDRTRKKEIRARMATTGESYSVAARHLAEDDGPPVTGDAAEIAACAVRTLAEPSARMATGTHWILPRLADMGLAVRLIGTAVKTYWKWTGPDVDMSHIIFEGFAEPAAGRYMIDNPHGLAELRIAGTTYSGRAGRPLDDIPFSGRSESGDALWFLRLLPGIMQASPEGTETLRGTPCRKFSVRVDMARAVAASPVKLEVPRGIVPGRMLQPSLAFTVWIDDQHVRQTLYLDEDQRDGTRPPPEFNVSRDDTLELWDFGVAVGGLDWSQLPGTVPPDKSSSWVPWRRKIHRD